jgi:hypothetical protein
MIVGLTGAAGSGKDTVADILVQHRGFQRIAFADALYEEVSVAFNVPIGFLRNRETKESPTSMLALRRCADKGFRKTVADILDARDILCVEEEWRSSRQILQWWGTEYRRAQRKDYWTSRVAAMIREQPDQHFVVTDVRFPDEAEVVRGVGGIIAVVVRSGIAPVSTHVSESFWKDCKPDWKISNMGSLDDLRETVLSEKRIAALCPMCIKRMTQCDF